MGTFHLSSWCGSNLQQTKRLLSRSDRQTDRRTDGQMDVINLFRVPCRNSVKMDFACCSFDSVFWPNVDALHLPFTFQVSPFLSSTFLRCDNVCTKDPHYVLFPSPSYFISVRCKNIILFSNVLHSCVIFILLPQQETYFARSSKVNLKVKVEPFTSTSRRHIREVELRLHAFL